MANNIEEFWVMHRPRHPIWGQVMFASNPTTTATAPAGTAVNTSLYTGDEKDYLFYQYTQSGNKFMYAVTEKPWLIYSILHSMQDATAAAKRIISYVGQDNVRICKVVQSQINISY